MKDWDCLGPSPAHPVDLERIETPLPSFTSEIAIERCRVCGQLYRYQLSEISDWSGGRDYSDETRTWIPIDKDEIEIVRSDFNYRPRSKKRHEHSTGWM
jgi:hypothetical protein